MSVCVFQVRTVASQPMPPTGLIAKKRDSAAVQLVWKTPVHHGGAVVAAYEVQHAVLAPAAAELPLSIAVAAVADNDWTTLKQVYFLASHCLSRLMLQRTVTIYVLLDKPGRA